MADAAVERSPQTPTRRTPVGRKTPIKKQRPDEAPADTKDTSAAEEKIGKKGEQPQQEAPDVASEGQGRNEGNVEEEKGEEATETNENEDQQDEGDVIQAGTVDENGNIIDGEGNVIGKVSEGGSQPPAGSVVDQEGDVLDDEGNIIGKAQPLDNATDATGESKPDTASEATEKPALSGPFKIQDQGQVTDKHGKVIGKVEEEKVEALAGKEVENIDREGNVLGEDGNILGKVDFAESVENRLKEQAAKNPPDFSILEGKKINKLGKVVDDNGNPVGKLVEGDAKKLAGKTVSADGKIWNDAGKVIGRAEPLPEDEREPASTSPFEDFPDALVDKSGKILYEGKQVGVLVEGDAKKLAGKKVDADGDVLDKNGNVLGKAERQDEEEPEEAPPEEADRSILAGKKVNKAGNVVDDSGAVVGRVVQGDIKLMVGKKVDGQGKIYNDVGHVIGQAEPIPEDEREEPSQSPFEDFPNSVVESSGNVVCDGKVIGKVVEGDAKKLSGKKVDADGDIVDKNGNVLGKAERWEEEEKAPEEVDMSALAGKRVNKAGNVVDAQGNIFGRLIEGDVKRLAGKMCDKNGFVRNEGGDVVGKAELLPESEREGLKEGPFADFPGCTVRKDGKVVDAQGEVVGKLKEGDGAKLYGKTVDEDGDVVDKNGNVLGKAERWEEEEVKKDVNPMADAKSTGRVM